MTKLVRVLSAALFAPASLWCASNPRTGVNLCSGCVDNNLMWRALALAATHDRAARLMLSMLRAVHSHTSSILNLWQAV